MHESFVFAAGAQAFGDGSHPTTRGVLAALENIDPALFTPQHACDMGAGSGIAALAIAQRFHCPVLAIDILPESVETIRKNAAANDHAECITALQADGFNHPSIAAAAPYDLIVMNILAAPLLRLASDAERYLAADGVLILSGILLWQEPQIQEAYALLGLELTSRLSVADWVTQVWQKP